MPRVLHWIDTTDNEPKGIPTIITAARLALRVARNPVSVWLQSTCIHTATSVSFTMLIATYYQLISDRTCTLRPVTVVIPQHETSTSPASVFQQYSTKQNLTNELWPFTIRIESQSNPNPALIITQKYPAPHHPSHSSVHHSWWTSWSCSSFITVHVTDQNTISGCMHMVHGNCQ